MYLLFLRDSAFKKRMHFSLGTVLCLSQQWTSSSKNLHILREIYYLLPVLIVPHPWWKFPQIVFPVFLVILSFFLLCIAAKYLRYYLFWELPNHFRKLVYCCCVLFSVFKIKIRQLLKPSMSSSIEQHP